MPDTMREYVAAQKALEEPVAPGKRHWVASERYWKRSWQYSSTNADV